LAGLPIMIIFWKKIKFSLQDLPEMSLNGLASTVLTLWILYLGVARTTAIEASIITMPAGIFIVFGGALFLREKIRSQEKVGIAIVLLGSTLLVAEPLILNHQRFSFSHTLGNIFCLGYNIFWAFSALWMKKIANKYHPFSLVYISFVVGLIGFFVLSLLENPQFLQINYFSLPYASFASIYMGILGSAVAVFLYQYGQKIIEASEAALFGYLSSIFAAPIAVLWLGEKITLPFTIGSLLVIVGVFLAESRKRLFKG
jgi:drug/metabolite transporter (DMT)-like permease